MGHVDKSVFEKEKWQTSDCALAVKFFREVQDRAQRWIGGIMDASVRENLLELFDRAIYPPLDDDEGVRARRLEEVSETQQTMMDVYRQICEIIPDEFLQEDYDDPDDE